jgi:dimethylhistidine N-methyltransferase
VGSALFEAITLLPEYGITRAEERLLYSYAEEITWQIGPVTTVAELGSGTGMKTQWLLEAITEQRNELVYFAIDVSNTSLEKCRDRLLRVPGVDVRTLYATYLEGLAKVRHEKPRSGRMLVLFLGSSLGNFHDGEATVFLKQARRYLLPGDAILIGSDLVKSPGALINAYDDPAGVTSAFNLNLLSRINRELGGGFHLRSFRHDVRWRPLQNRIEMHLVSQDRQVVTVRDAACEATFEPGESIWTETSQKFTITSLGAIAAQAGFRSQAQWIDVEWPFAESLWIAE